MKVTVLAILVWATCGAALAQTPPSARPAGDAWRDLAAAVRPAEPDPDAAPPGLQEHEDRAAEALAPDSPSGLAEFQPSGAGCGQGAGMLSCATNQEVGAQPTPDNTDPTPDRDLMGQPR